MNGAEGPMLLCEKCKLDQVWFGFICFEPETMEECRLCSFFIVGCPTNYMRVARQLENHL